MFSIKTIRCDHKDIIHDVVYDYYGKRIATCSSDQTIKVWDHNELDGWSITSSWKAHCGSIWRLCWAHPEFGQVLVSCSFDRNVSVWEEVVSDKLMATTVPVKQWTRRTNLVDSRTSVTDAKFGPKHLGLLLATACSDGVIRVYEATDIMNLSQWSLQHEIYCKVALSCLSWSYSTTRLQNSLIVAGSDDTSNSSGGKVFIYEYSENVRKSTKIETYNEIIDQVHDIAFAPNHGRTYHTIAVAGRDLSILYIKLDTKGNSKLDIQLAAQLTDHHCTVWRVGWNVTGTFLASTGNDGCVRIWKMSYMKNWKCIVLLKAEGNVVSENSIANVGKEATSAITKYVKKGTIVNANQVPWH